MIRVRRLVSIDPDNPALFDRQRQLAMFQRQCRFAEQLAAPAVQRGHVGMIVGSARMQLHEALKTFLTPCR